MTQARKAVEPKWSGEGHRGFLQPAQQRLANHVHVFAQGINVVGEGDRGGEPVGGFLDPVQLSQPFLAGFRGRVLLGLVLQQFQLAVVAEYAGASSSNMRSMSVAAQKGR